MSGKFNQLRHEGSYEMNDLITNSKVASNNNYIGKALARMKKGETDNEIYQAALTNWKNCDDPHTAIAIARKKFNSRNGNKKADQLELGHISNELDNPNPDLDLFIEKFCKVGRVFIAQDAADILGVKRQAIYNYEIRLTKLGYLFKKKDGMHKVISIPVKDSPILSTQPQPIIQPDISKIVRGEVARILQEICNYLVTTNP